MQSRLLAAASLLITSFTLQAAAPAPAAPPLVVHEWGTFTSVQGHTGKQVWWLPHLATELPQFVYDRHVQDGGFKGLKLIGSKGTEMAILRMETPVIYFYSDIERAVDVRVSLPQGQITEWYPQATRIGPYYTTDGRQSKEEMTRSLIEWKGVTILPRTTAEISASNLIRATDGPQTDHYYSARATDANLLRVSSPHARKGTEYERDLFYRGLTEFPGPLTATVDPGETQLILTAAGPEPLSDLFVMTVKQGLMRYQRVDRVTPNQSTDVTLDAVPFADLNDVRAHLMEDVVKALVGHGLYEKEARAMVDTWKDQWFAEEGSRVLYLLPRAWTDRVLPLQVTPRPDRVVRVMVGRAEVIMPSIERRLQEEVQAFSMGDADAQARAVMAVQNMNLGRFLQPAGVVVMGSSTDSKLWNTVSSLTERAKQKPIGASATALNH
jgi:hypothetical protein